MDNMFAVVLSHEELDELVSLKKFLDKFSRADDFSILPDDYFDKLFDYSFLRSSLGIKCLSQILQQLKNGNMFD